MRLFGLSAFVGATLIGAAAFAQDTIISHGISAYGDLKYGPDFEHLDYVNPDAPKGGEYTDWTIGSFDSMHPYTTKGRPSFIFSDYAFEGLMVGVADEPDALYGLIAETVEYPEDRQWAAFNLRPEATFSDGTPVTPEDIVFTYETLLNKGIPSLRTVFADVESVTVEGPNRVKFTFVEGAPTRTLPALVAGLPVFSKKFWEDKDFSESTLDPGPGTGPYVIDEIDVGRKVVLRKNPDWWAKDLPIMKGQYNFETIREEFFQEPIAAFEAFKTGDLTIRLEGESKQWATGYDFPAFNDGYVVREELPNGALPTAGGYYFNLRKEKFQDIRVRRAITRMFNFEWSNQTLFFGYYNRLDSFWENSHLEAQGTITDAERAILEPLAEHFPETLFTDEVVTMPLSSTTQTDRRAIREANRLLDEAGWELVDGVRMKDGEVLEIEFMLASPTWERFTNPFAENLKRIGVQTKLNLIDVPQYLERRRAHDYDLLITAYNTDLVAGVGLRQWFNSANADGATRNFAGLKNEGIDRLVEMSLEANNREDMEVILTSLDRALRSLEFFVPRWYLPEHWVAYWDIYGRPDVVPPYALPVGSTWWFDQEKFDKLTAEGAL